MVKFILWRIGILIPLLVLVSIVSFIVIQLPPGDYVDSYIRNLELQGGSLNDAQKETLQRQYGLDKPLIVQYFMWISKIVLHGDFGNSFKYQRPVADLLMERIPRTIFLSLASIFFTWIIAIPIGILSALKKYTIWDYFFTFLSFLGLSIPGFLLALILLYIVFTMTGNMITGLFSPEYRDAPWSIAKFTDMLHNVWLPLLVLSVTGSGGLVRVLRATLLDELKKQYVTTARAKGLAEWRVIMQYPIRIAINPIISTIGWMLPGVVGGELVVSKVLNIPTVGPMMLDAVLSQDMYLAGGFVLILCSLTVVGTLVSDILLAWSDPRIRFD
ncbi:ABC transporter permease [Anaerolinea sp.]|nr:ABC transporter permease [Anaerolinea sp.]